MSKNQRPFLLGALIIVPLCLCMTAVCASLITYLLLGEQTKDALPDVTENITYDDDPVAHYEFEDNTNDSSQYENHGTSENDLTFIDGPLGQAIFFENETELRVFVSDRDSLDTDYGFALCAWIKPTHYRNGQGRNAYHMILSKWWTTLKRGDYILSIQVGDDEGLLALTVANAEPEFTADGLRALSSHRIPLNEWTHVAATFDRGAMKLFIDGTLVAEKMSAVVLHAKLDEYSFDDVMIGNARANAYNEHGFIGGIDDVRIYNRALSETEIVQLSRID